MKKKFNEVTRRSAIWHKIKRLEALFYENHELYEKELSLLKRRKDLQHLKAISCDQSETFTTRLIATRLVFDIEKDVDFLIDLIKNKNIGHHQKTLAAYLCHKIKSGDKDAYSKVIQLLKEEDTKVYGTIAVVAIGKYIEDEVLAVLTDFNESTDTKIAAAIALGYIGDTQTAERLEMIANLEFNFYLREALHDSAERIRKNILH